MSSEITVRRVRDIFVACGLCGAFLTASLAARAQATTGTGPTTSTQAGEVQGALQQLSAPAGQSLAAPTDDSFRGSVVTGNATGGVIDLPLDDAIARGLRQNLGILLQESQQQGAKGQELEQLQTLLPTVTGDASIEVQQVNLAAFGLKFPGLNPIIGPFQVVDFRAYLTQSLVNVTALENYIAAKHNFTATKLTAEDARDLVVLTVGNAYLLCIADAARIDAVNAQMATSKVSLDQAIASHDAGTSPRLDVLRAQVDYQNEQQNLISATNQLAKDKLALARVIGLPLDQQFRLSDTEPFKALDNVNADAAFEQAVKNRKDLAAAKEQVAAARAQKTAAFADQLPTVKFAGDFGDMGTTPGHSHGTYTATGTVSAPILQIAKTRGEEKVADANYQQASDRLSDKVQQVNADIRDAILDIQSAAKLVDTAKSNLDLANEELSEAQQRFHAGVADNLPVSQAQSSVEQANNQYISALYQHNAAKLSLARALGVAQTNLKDYLGGK
ncbi:MAG TPA: TolC family protein [Acidobacteriaceae bacterium]|jgi:outer membrane protein TolC|nr:TolC family protein [Acidobacteriaceae bacterium]